jgi:hypothetical protein
MYINMRHKMKEYPNSYTCSAYLKEYLKETEAIARLKDDYSADNRELGKHDKLRVRSNDAEKVRILRKNIFGSMANLIYFFEFLNKHPELISKFGDDVEELFGLRATKNMKSNTFPRLVYALLGYDDSRNDTKERFNYRRRLLKIMQDCINAKMLNLAMHNASWPIQSPGDNRLKHMVLSDMQRADVWANFFDKLTDREYHKPSRIIDF